MTIPGHRTCYQMQQMTPADNYSVIVQLQRRWLINDLDPCFGQSQVEREEERAQCRELGGLGEDEYELGGLGEEGCELSSILATGAGRWGRPSRGQGRDSRTPLGDCSGT